MRSAFTIPHVTEWVEVDATRSVKLVTRLRETPGFTQARVSPLLLVARAVLMALQVVAGRQRGLGRRHAGGRLQGLRQPRLRGRHPARPRRPQHQGRRPAVAARARDGALGPGRARPRTGVRRRWRCPAGPSPSRTSVSSASTAAPRSSTPARARSWPSARSARSRGCTRAAYASRWIAGLTLSFDHRFIDGATGSRFLADVAAVLHDPAVPPPQR